MAFRSLQIQLYINRYAFMDQSGKDRPCHDLLRILIYAQAKLIREIFSQFQLQDLPGNRRPVNFKIFLIFQIHLPTSYPGQTGGFFIKNSGILLFRDIKNHRIEDDGAVRHSIRCPKTLMPACGSGRKNISPFPFPFDLIICSYLNGFHQRIIISSFLYLIPDQLMMVHTFLRTHLPNPLTAFADMK